MKLHYINPSDRDFTEHRYILAFGAYGWTQILVHADCLQDALDVAVDVIAERFPGLLCDDQVTEAYGEAIAEGKSEEEAWELAEVDTISAGNYGNRILAYEFDLVAENPTRAEIKAYEIEVTL